MGSGKDQGGADPAPQVPTSSPQKKSSANCRFYNTKNGCRAGYTCPFVHDSINTDSSNASRPQTLQSTQTAPSTESARDAASRGATLLKGRSFVSPPVNGSRVVSKPIPKAQIEDPREFQIKQLKRRFSPEEKDENGGTAFTFQMVPSDPDFPFEMVGLECVLHVPVPFPKEGKPSLDVRNKEMGRGYQINIERGFAKLAERSPQSTLLGLLNALDKQLESLLVEQEAETVTFIPNNLARKNAIKSSSLDLEPPLLTQPGPRSKASNPLQAYTAQQLRIASSRREIETRQLEARIGRLPLFSKCADDIAYIIPVTPRKHFNLPVPLQAVKTVKLFIPLLYPLEHCSIEIQDVSREAAIRTEKCFERNVKENHERGLMGHVNYLAQNMHVLATGILEEENVTEEMPKVSNLALEDSRGDNEPLSTVGDEHDRSHIILIPRPPEWSFGHEGAGSSDSEYSDSSDSGNEDTEDEEVNGVPLPSALETSTTAAPERGISLSFPLLELYGIEVLELIALCIALKCQRCKDIMDISNLRDISQGDASRIRNESCKKCASQLSVAYRRELMHANSVRAGYLDLEGCTVVDMLPSNFLPTCSECSTTNPGPGIVSVRGESSMAICRECHRKMTFKIPEVKFLLVSASARSNHAPVRKKPKESLGITPNTPLPSNGKCPHYSKSYRWFRFSCCSKVYPCDRCHDAASDHPNEHANRMICGWCSREQNYRPEDCGICHAGVVKKGGTGFWEGGRGTRDKGRMSRKDPRKYKRRPGGIARKIKAGGTGVVTGKA